MKKNYLIVIATFIFFKSPCYSQIVKKEFFKDGNVSRIYEVNKENINSGLDIHYFENGKMSEKKKWDNGKLVDSLYTYNEEGELKTKGYIDKNRLLKLYKDNSLYYEGKLEKDMLEGLVAYYKNDNIVMSKVFQNNKENGVGILLDDNTLKPKFIYEANNDVRNGILMEFYENGTIRSFRTKSLESNFYQYFEFHSNGTLKSIGCKSNGVYDGYVYFFNEDGKSEKKVLYKEGKITSE